MAGKLGEERFQEMKGRGWRELGGLFYTDSNIAQPQYPSRGGYEVTKEADSPGLGEHGSTLDNRPEPPEAPRDDPGRDGPDIDRDV